MKGWLEYIAARSALTLLGILPRPLARALGVQTVRLLYWLRPPLRRAAHWNLKLAFPDGSAGERRRVIRGVIRQVGWMAAEFSRFPRYTRESIERVVLLDGFENYAAARDRGKGVLFLTGHFSAWELAPFAQALFGHPLHFLARPIDNSRVNRLINGYRSFSGNRPINKNQSARAILSLLRAGETVGVLIDQNASLDEGVFVDFFGTPACTSSGLARVALRTDAAVVPGFLLWDSTLRKYRLRLDPAVELTRTGDDERDIRENTARFTRVVEDFARRNPDQWLWVHKRWKTRPPGEPPLYPF
ncbi:MAG TPA: lysophospholipid acyltransferase family protein [Candidatus Dormibacteraeota bacterium]|nr:lysophospholipid acyltransferase family protein [Candidatus Dormibacteraeota bacterium]